MLGILVGTPSFYKENFHFNQKFELNLSVGNYRVLYYDAVTMYERDALNRNKCILEHN